MALRIGVVGAGDNTRARHIPGFQEIDDVDVVAVCNQQNLVKLDGSAGFSVQFLYFQELAFSDLVLLAAGNNDCVHVAFSVILLTQRFI